VSWRKEALLVATDRRLLLISKAGPGERCESMARADLHELRAAPGRVGITLTIGSAATTWRLTPLEDGWLQRLADALAPDVTLDHAPDADSPQALADGGTVNLGWRPPASFALIVWLNALMALPVAAVFLWAALYPFLGGATTEPTVLGIGFTGMSTTFDAADFALTFGMGIAFLGFLLMIVIWLGRNPNRVIADRDGIALRTRGRSRYSWEQIDRFEIGGLLAEGVVHLEAVDGHCAVMVLRDGERVPLEALRTWEPFGDDTSDEIAARVATLNRLREALTAS
jgi:hypothetical protein